MKGTKTFISGVLPLLEIQITVSSSWMFPRSPWIASAACIKIAGVPVEFIVATILFAIMALFPIPVIITLPLELNMKFTAFSKSELINFFKLAIALLSMSIVSKALSIIVFVFFKSFNFVE